MSIELYIGDQLVDLDDQSFILYNYALDDLYNPTIVKNSFSQQITLRGTPNNNRIFGSFFKTTRRNMSGGDTGVTFNASQKTPFTIYKGSGEILESGYVRLDSIDRNGSEVKYKISLFGGLGSFFYSLSYSDDGSRKTLADLDFLGTPNPETELDFAITKEAVKDAWDRLQGDQSAAEMWDVINFAPAYNGIPEGSFSPDKAIVAPGDVGLRDSITDGGVTYTTKSGYCLVNMAQAQDEWAVKDLRSYMQRPILSMRAFWDAICNPANNGGYEVDASIVKDYQALDKYAYLWMTLPMISSIGTIQEQSGNLSLTMASSASSGNDIGSYIISGSVPAGTKVTTNINCRVRFNMPSGANSYTSLLPMVSQTTGRNTTSKISVIFIQAVAYGSDDTIVGGSPIKAYAGTGVRNLSQVAEDCGFTPAWPSTYESLSIQSFDKVSSGVFEIPRDLPFTIEAKDVAYYKILVSVYSGERSSFSGRTTTTYSGDGSTSTPVMYVDYSTQFTANSAFIVSGASADTITYESPEVLRSGATITKRMLLSSSHTPAEYMISFCKIFGLYFSYDNAERKVTILRRNDLFQDETIDLTDQIDISRDISIQPMSYNAKWYDFLLEGVGGGFQEEYENVEGIPYGIQRVNTGYDFNADAVNLLEGVVFKNACSILAKSRYFNYIFQGGVFKPSPFLDKGNTFTLWSAAGETLETPISCPLTSASVTYYNTLYHGYDSPYAVKLELRTADNKPVDGSDILVFIEGFTTYDHFKLTDDLPAMDILNDGVPCWLIADGNGVTIPNFRRYVILGGETIMDSLDFGVPRQMDIPNLLIDGECTLYDRAWKRYMSDRYDANTKVMTCRVYFTGMQVGQDLLRKFYWYDNSLWVLNAIRNYSLTTHDPVECEFVQVMDKDNYLNGQHFRREL